MTNMLNFQSIEFDMNDEVNVSKGIRIFDKSSILSSISNITLYFTFADNVIQLSRFCYNYAHSPPTPTWLRAILR